MTRKRLTYIDGEVHWVEIGPTDPKRKEGKEDLTVDGFISKYGGIYSHADGKTHTSKSSYMEGIKASGCHIKDYK